ncbi:hypothetical protein DFS33DRAFT_1382301 [Desarmillaria ectypa]|nr:hypothetical protein DFS33DRAFT_1382301 [Desarmillaria ectypa]
MLFTGWGSYGGLFKYNRQAVEDAARDGADSGKSLPFVWWKVRPEVLYFGEYLFNKSASDLNPLLLKALAHIAIADPSSIERGTEFVELAIYQKKIAQQQQLWVETGAYGDDKTPQKERKKPVSEYLLRPMKKPRKTETIPHLSTSLRSHKVTTTSAEHSDTDPKSESSLSSVPSTPTTPSNQPQKGRKRDTNPLRLCISKAASEKDNVASESIFPPPSRPQTGRKRSQSIFDLATTPGERGKMERPASLRCALTVSPGMIQHSLSVA